MDNELFLYCDFHPVIGRQYYYTVAWYLASGLTLTRHLWSSQPVLYLHPKDQGTFRSRTTLTETILHQKGLDHLGFEVRLILL